MLQTKLKIEMTLDQWLWLHRLIGATQGTLECTALQMKNVKELEHCVDPFRNLVEAWEGFLDSSLKNWQQEK